METVTKGRCNRLLTANHTRLSVRGQCTVLICIGDFVTNATYIVVEQLQHDLILGIDFLNVHKACIDTEGSRLTIGPDRTTVKMLSKPREQHTLRVANNFNLPSMHEALVRVTLPYGYKPCVSLIEAIQDPWNSDGILVARSCVDPHPRARCV